jgi:four helix bundle protein
MMTLDIYKFVLETIRIVGPVFDQIAKRDLDLARQGRRALSSVALNLAEGAGNDGGHRRERFRTALGSSKETLASLQIAEAYGYITLDAALAQRLDRIAATIYRLGH